MFTLLFLSVTLSRETRRKLTFLSLRRAGHPDKRPGWLIFSITLSPCLSGLHSVMTPHLRTSCSSLQRIGTTPEGSTQSRTCPQARERYCLQEGSHSVCIVPSNSGCKTQAHWRMLQSVGGTNWLDYLDVMRKFIFTILPSKGRVETEGKEREKGEG